MHGAKRAGACAKASADVGRMMLPLVVTLALVMPFSARAQDYPAPGSATNPSAVTSLDGTRQRLVGPHFDAQGRYVPPHYESANKKLPFRGYFAEQEKLRQAARQRGYAEPPPDYTTPIDPSQLKPMEGR